MELIYFHREIRNFFKEHGQKSSPRGLEVVELHDVMIEIPALSAIFDHLTGSEISSINAVVNDVLLSDPTSEFPIPFAVGTETSESWEEYASCNFKGRFNCIADLLLQDPSTRRAYLYFADPLSREAPPCCNYIAFSVKNKFLNCKVSFRSCDYINKFKYDIAIWATVFKLMAEFTDYYAGNIRFMFDNLHYYTKDIDKFRDITYLSE